MSWKDYLHFQKGERIAIITLLILIIVSGGIYIVTKPNSKNKAIEVDTNTLAEFKKFEASLTEKKEKADKNEFPSTYPSYPTYQRQEKLKKGETIEINSCDTNALKKIPKIGSGFANRIVKYRNLLGGYVSILQLKEVWGMDDYLYEDIIPYILLESNPQKLRINHLPFEKLIKHPYIDYKQAKVIVDIRDRKGNIESINHLGLLEEFPEKDISRLKPYLSFD